MATYIISDIHGCFLTLKHLIETKLQVSKSDRLYFLGDYIDRGPASAEVVEYLIGLKEFGYCVSFIMGNHEQMMLEAIQNRNIINTWFLNSGNITIESYRKLYGSFAEIDFSIAVPKKHLEFLANLPSYILIDDKFVLVHGGLDYRQSNPFIDEQTILWRRPEPIPDSFLPGKIIVHGHTPTPLNNIIDCVKDKNSRLIGLDAGCVYKGRAEGFGYLTALDVDSWTLFWTENIDF